MLMSMTTMLVGLKRNVGQKVTALFEQYTIKHDMRHIEWSDPCCCPTFMCSLNSKRMVMYIIWAWRYLSLLQWSTSFWTLKGHSAIGAPKAPPHARGTANAEGIYGMLSSKLLSLSALFPQLPGFEFSPSCFQDIKGHVCNDNLLYCATFLFDLQMHLTSICKAAEQDALLGK